MSQFKLGLSCLRSTDRFGSSIKLVTFWNHSFTFKTWADFYCPNWLCWAFGVPSVASIGENSNRYVKALMCKSILCSYVVKPGWIYYCIFVDISVSFKIKQNWLIRRKVLGWLLSSIGDCGNRWIDKILHTSSLFRQFVSTINLFPLARFQSIRITFGKNRCNCY